MLIIQKANRFNAPRKARLQKFMNGQTKDKMKIEVDEMKVDNNVIVSPAIFTSNVTK